MPQWKKENSWPCETHFYEECPGLNHQHCVACHGVYPGYILLCPTHNASIELRTALFEVMVSTNLKGSNSPLEEKVVQALRKAGMA